MLRVRLGCMPDNGKPYIEPPSWGICTRLAAELLECGASSARALLRRHRVAFRVVQEPGKQPCNYWKRAQVVALSQIRATAVPRIPPGMLTAGQAMKRLRVSRSALQRYVRRGYLRQVKLRIQTRRGTRTCACFPAEQVCTLTSLLRHLHTKEAELRKLREQFARILKQQRRA